MTTTTTTTTKEEVAVGHPGTPIVPSIPAPHHPARRSSPSSSWWWWCASRRRPVFHLRLPLLFHPFWKGLVTPKEVHRCHAGGRKRPPSSPLLLLLLLLNLEREVTASSPWHPGCCPHVFQQDFPRQRRTWWRRRWGSERSERGCGTKRYRPLRHTPVWWWWWWWS